ncbi:MAG: TetR/AcrR family transcriptional regulator [Verrucomicrobiota bacterium]
MRKANAKERILDTAGKLFFRHGYSEVGINEIIATAETAKASFYQHYPSKEALCEAWLSDVHDRSELSRADLLNANQSPAEKIGLYFDQLRDFMEQSDFRGCPYSNTGAVSSEECTGILEQIQSHKESIRLFFRKVCFAELADHDKANTAGDRIFLLYSGATTECQNLKQIWPVAVAREAALELLD